jgi:GNAT superfamily N-acetyltransferase
MDTIPQIVTVQPGQGKLVGEILADAFENDPVMNWVIPHTGLYTGFFRMLADKLFLQHQLVYRDAHNRGAAMWLPPGIRHGIPMCATQLALVARLVLHSGPGILRHLEQVQEVMNRHHPREPHYYLQSIGTRRDCQGQGIGSLLLKWGTRECDTNGMPAYLESSSPRNVPLYERHGFRVLAREPLGKDGPPLFFMWREPLS